jgi:hypothetical protein
LIDKEEYIYFHHDEIDYICFMFKGQAAITIPLSENKDFIDIQNGDEFG